MYYVFTFGISMLNELTSAMLFKFQLGLNVLNTNEMQRNAMSITEAGQSPLFPAKIHE